MRKIIIVAAACAALGACAPMTTGGFGTSTPGGQGTATTDPVVGQIQDITAKVCGFVPTVSTVLGIVTTFTGGAPIAAIAGDVATAICGALTKKTAKRGMGPPSVRGVPVQGYYLR